MAKDSPLGEARRDPKARPAIKNAGMQVAKQFNDPTKRYTLKKGKKGGTFYLNANGKKVYPKKG